MKNYLKYFLCIIAMYMVTQGCKNATEETKIEKATKEKAKVEKTEETNPNSYVAIPSKSKIGWKGRYVTGFEEGTIDIVSGKAQVIENKLIGGNFTFAIKSLKVGNFPREKGRNEKLVTHLLSPEIFEAEKYPDAHF